MNSFTDVAPECLEVWGKAAGAQVYAQENPSPEAWARAGRYWDALAAIQRGRDRIIYKELAVEAWFKAAGIKRPAHRDP